MDKVLLTYSRLILLFFILFFSCQKEISDDAISAGSLQKDIFENCLPVTVGGNFYIGNNLVDTNYIEVGVNVTSRGRYTIKTDTVNGYWFTGTGSFAKAGSYRVKLTGSGRPNNIGINDFTIRYDSSVCHVTVEVTDDLNKAAIFVFQGASGPCMDDSVMGTYIKDITLDTTAKVRVSVLATRAGTFSITTNTVNGYKFSTTGVLRTRGIQNVILTGTGKPVNADTDIFNATANGITSCSFKVIVLTPVNTANTDYFPLTTNSHWSYTELFQAGDSMQRKITDSVTINNNLYKIMDQQSLLGNPVSYNFRKAGWDYYEYCSVDRYTNSVQYASPLYGLIPFLKENLNTNDSWQSEEFSAMANFGQIIRIQYLFSCIDANASVTVNGHAFTHVYKVVMRPQIASVGNGWGYTNEVYTYYFAKGIGMIYCKKIRNGFMFSELLIRNWLVN
jgi:hypothetical protein